MEINQKMIFGINFELYFLNHAIGNVKMIDQNDELWLRLGVFYNLRHKNFLLLTICFIFGSYGNPYCLKIPI